MMFTSTQEKESEETQPLKAGWEQSCLEATLSGADVQGHFAMSCWGKPAASWVCISPNADLKQQFSL